MIGNLKNTYKLLYILKEDFSQNPIIHLFRTRSAIECSIDWIYARRSLIDIFILEHCFENVRQDMCAGVLL